MESKEKYKITLSDRIRYWTTNEKIHGQDWNRYSILNAFLGVGIFFILVIYAIFYSYKPFPFIFEEEIIFDIFPHMRQELVYLESVGLHQFALNFFNFQANVLFIGIFLTICAILWYISTLLLYGKPVIVADFSAKFIYHYPLKYKSYQIMYAATNNFLSKVVMLLIFFLLITYRSITYFFGLDFPILNVYDYRMAWFIYSDSNRPAGLGYNFDLDGINDYKSCLIMSACLWITSVTLISSVFSKFLVIKR